MGVNAIADWVVVGLICLAIFAHISPQASKVIMRRLISTFQIIGHPFVRIAALLSFAICQAGFREQAYVALAKCHQFVDIVS